LIICEQTLLRVKKCVIFLLSKANADNMTVYWLEGVDYQTVMCGELSF